MYEIYIKSDSGFRFHGSFSIGDSETECTYLRTMLGLSCFATKIR